MDVALSRELETVETKVILLSILDELKKLNEAKPKDEKNNYGLVLSIKEAAKYSGIKEAKLYKMAREKEGFPVIKDGESNGRIFVSKEGLDKWIKENTGKII